MKKKTSRFFSEVYGWERVQIPSNKEWQVLAIYHVHGL